MSGVDFQFIQIWNSYAMIVTQRQRVLQNILAYIIDSDVSIVALYNAEVSQPLPVWTFSPTSKAGEHALKKYTDAVAGYDKTIGRFKELYNL